jgi:ABC-type branched-subunit amino acid transport system ATPase component
LSVATALADQIFIMVAGRTTLETTADQLLASEEMRRHYLGVDNRIH